MVVKADVYETENQDSRMKHTEGQNKIWNWQEAISLIYKIWQLQLILK